MDEGSGVTASVNPIALLAARYEPGDFPAHVGAIARVLMKPRSPGLDGVEWVWHGVFHGRDAKITGMYQVEDAWERCLIEVIGAPNDKSEMAENSVAPVVWLRMDDVEQVEFLWRAEEVMQLYRMREFQRTKEDLLAKMAKMDPEELERMVAELRANMAAEEAPPPEEPQPSPTNGAAAHNGAPS